MKPEIERRFLLSKPIPKEFLGLMPKNEIKQGFLTTDINKVVRVRMQSKFELPCAQAFLTVKGRSKGEGFSRAEIESEDQEIEIPDWLGAEITSDHRFSNVGLSRTPWREFMNQDSEATK